MSTNRRYRELATDLTTSYVASSSERIYGAPHHHFDIVYDPDENDGKVLIQVQGTSDDETVADASAEWTTLGTVSRSNGAVTFTADTIGVAGAAAGTKVYAHITYTDQPFYRIRVQAKDSFTAGGSNVGNVRIHGYHYGY